jgi:hypothetical protein
LFRKKIKRERERERENKYKNNMLEAGNIYKYEKFIIYKLTIFLKPHPKIISLWLNGLRKHFVKFNRMGIGAPELL